MIRLHIEVLEGDQAVAWMRVFVAKAGASLTSFRYFQTRPIEVVRRHTLTLFGFVGEECVAYGHIDPSGLSAWLGVCVVADYVGRGYGRKIVEALVAYADTCGVTLRLKVDQDNTRAIRLYESVGFVALSDGFMLRKRGEEMPETLGSVVDRLATVNQKMFVNQEILYEIRRMSFDEYKTKYFSDEGGARLLWDALKKACDLNVQRAQLVEDVDRKLVEIVRGLMNGESVDRFVQPQHKTY